MQTIQLGTKCNWLELGISKNETDQSQSRYYIFAVLLLLRRYSISITSIPVLELVLTKIGIIISNNIVLII